MQKIVPHLWFDTQAKEAAELYTSLFPDSKVNSVTKIMDTPSGDAHMVVFSLAGQDFMAISAGPIFKLNPAISLFVTFDSEAEIEKVWSALSEGGKVLMAYDTYPWATKYGWLQDKYGLSWQLSMSEHHQMAQRITPLLMFTNAQAGKAKEAIEKYTALFPNSAAEMMVPYEKGEGDTEGFLKHARFTLGGQHFMAMDSSAPHQFTFNEAVSLVVNCDTQEEIDTYWEALSAVPASEQCGWLKDEFGVSWQIVPRAMGEMMTKGSREQVNAVTQAFIKMKKFDIKELEEAYSAAS
jgi:predicted 3-demethylubiquinone-9 3-methyltransferase (glyoxalase superfamily)